MTEAIRAETAHSFVHGGRIAAALGVTAGLGLGVVTVVSGDPFFRLPAVFAGVGAVASLLLSWTARRGALRGVTRYAVMLPLVSLPTGMFLVSHATLPAGAATYLTGPFLSLYAFLIVLSGFLLSFRLSVWAGVVVAVEYLGVFALAQPVLARVQTGDAALSTDLSSWPVALNRAGMFVAIGFATGGIARLVRRLVLRVTSEAREKAMVNRLFGQYVSEEARERIVSATAGLVGERVHAAVLFSDLRGFTTFSEQHPPEEVVARLNEYFETMVAAIHGEGGVVDKFIGDAVMATFGAVHPLDAPEQAAVRAALGMRAGLAALNTSWAAKGQATLDNGVGLHAGDVVVGPIGSEARKDFTVIGDTVNTASRLESQCKELGVHVVVSDEVYQRLLGEQRARFRALGEVAVKGRSRPVVVWGAD
ncbi:MAG: adenylate/guanylate cyclase domain-containing protein [Myxococcaceae bacterium]|nr:adenylate/guanylate cyclase domain-containing protein [Myxococcaceae bacterium]